LEHVPDNHPREFKVIDNENLDLSLGGAVVFFRLQLFTLSQKKISGMWVGVTLYKAQRLGVPGRS
jgi:hypothetical protein